MEYLYRRGSSEQPGKIIALKCYEATLEEHTFATMPEESTLATYNCCLARSESLPSSGEMRVLHATKTSLREVLESGVCDIDTE